MLRAAEGLVLLEVRCSWGSALEVLHAPLDRGAVTLTSTHGDVWFLAGRPIGVVPPGFRPWLGATPGSRVEARPLGDLLVADEVIDGERTRVLAVARHGVALLRAADAWSPAVRVHGDEADFRALVAEGRAERRGDGWSVVMTEGVEVTLRLGHRTCRCRVVPPPR